MSIPDKTLVGKANRQQKKISCSIKPVPYIISNIILVHSKNKQYIQNETKKNTAIA